MNDQSLTETQLVSTITSLLSDITRTIDDVPALLDPAGQRHGRRRQGSVRGPGQQRRLLQLQLAQAALAVAQAAVQEPAALALLAEQTATLQRRLADLQRLGHGSIEEREVLRPCLVETVDPATSKAIMVMGKRAFGPYAYYRWTEGDKLRSLYLGRADTPASWLWKLEELGVDLVALGLVSEAEAEVRALNVLREASEDYVRVLEQIQDPSKGGGDV